MSETTGTPYESVVAEPKQTVKRPKLFRVLLHNDHYTSMEFVVHILQTIFHKNDAEAVEFMLNVHQNGIGVAGMYALAVAETKTSKVHTMAKNEGFPLRCTMEPE